METGGYLLLVICLFLSSCIRHLSCAYYVLDTFLPLRVHDIHDRHGPCFHGAQTQQCEALFKCTNYVGPNTKHINSTNQKLKTIVAVQFLFISYFFNSIFLVHIFLQNSDLKNKKYALYPSIFHTKIELQSLCIRRILFLSLYV